MYMYLWVIFMPYWNFEYTKDVSLHCGKSEVGGMGQVPATEVRHFKKSTSD